MTDQYFGITDTGKERTNNEDAFIARQGAGDKFIIGCVIDGVGGYEGGEVAAGLAREAILQRLAKPSGEVISMIIDCFDMANERIIVEKQRNKKYDMMSCVSTLAIADVANNQFYYAHVGDTRLYLLRDGSLIKISHDQSFVGFLEESGRLSEKEAMTHPKRNEINKALGFEAHLLKNTDYIETGQSPFLSGDLLLLCSDGLTDMVSSEEITGILTKDITLKEKGRQLIDAANRNGGRDNITVVLVHNNKTPQKHSATAVKRQPAENTVTGKTEQPVKEEDPEPPAAKSNRWLVVLLSVLLLICLAGNVYFYMERQNQQTPITALKSTNDIVKKVPGALQVKLQKALDSLKGKVLVLSDTIYKIPIILNEPIRINRDTLLIRTKGRIVFQADSAYNGPALLAAPRCKIIALDSVGFNGFTIAIANSNAMLDLAHVDFNNCKQAIRNELSLPAGKYFTGKNPAIILKADTVPAKKK